MRGKLEAGTGQLDTSWATGQLEPTPHELEIRPARRASWKAGNYLEAGFSGQLLNGSGQLESNELEFLKKISHSSIT